MNRGKLDYNIGSYAGKLALNRLPERIFRNALAEGDRPYVEIEILTDKKILPHQVRIDRDSKEA
ncbi:MAG: hypothetical protein ACM3SP_21350 [Chloroflexota bacterium]